MMSPETVGLARLDASGFIPAPGESSRDFLARVSNSISRFSEFNQRLAEEGEAVVFDELLVKAADRIPDQLFDEAAEITGARYGFAIRHVPGFFLSRAVGMLWGGCLIGDPDEGFSVFLIRGAFRSRTKWLFYRRSELMAHELCHSARQPLLESTLEEYFAYQTSPSFLRRYLGNCFIHDRDAIIFIIPALVLLAAQLVQLLWWPPLPIWPFWILALAYPAYLLRRNQLSRNIVKRAEKHLRACGVEAPEAVLFRCTLEEIRDLGVISNRAALDEYSRRRAAVELRWQIIDYRFINPPPPFSEPIGNEAVDPQNSSNPQEEANHGIL